MLTKPPIDRSCAIKSHVPTGGTPGSRAAVDGGTSNVTVTLFLVFLERRGVCV
jgi:hypothetical protein